MKVHTLRRAGTQAGIGRRVVSHSQAGTGRRASKQQDTGRIHRQAGTGRQTQAGRRGQAQAGIGRQWQAGRRRCPPTAAAGGLRPCTPLRTNGTALCASC